MKIFNKMVRSGATAPPDSSDSEYDEQEADRILAAGTAKDIIKTHSLSPTCSPAAKAPNRRMARQQAASVVNHGL